MGFGLPTKQPFGTKMAPLSRRGHYGAGGRTTNGSDMSQLFQIYEDDLSELERTIPQFANALMPALNNRLRTQLRRIQEILSNVRWNYGPPTEVETLPHDDGEPHLPD